MDQVQRARWIVVADFVGSHDHTNRNRLARYCGFGSLDADFDDRPFGPFIMNFRNGDVALQPFLRKLHLLVGAAQMQKRRNKTIRGEEAVTAVFVIVGGAIVVGGIASSGIMRFIEGHVAFTAFDGGAWIAFVIPMAGGPVVILVL